MSARCPLSALSGHLSCSVECPLSGEKRTSLCHHLQPVLAISHTLSLASAMILPRGRRYHHMQRRQFIALLGGAAAAWPFTALAQQQAGKVPRIGFLQRIRNENVVAFIQGLRDAGYFDGQNALIETRIYETTLDRLPDLAKELVDLKCDVVVAGSQYAFEAVMRATSTIPIVGIDLESDPVASVTRFASGLAV